MFLVSTLKCEVDRSHPIFYHMEYLAAKYLITCQQDINGSERFQHFRQLLDRKIDGRLVIVDLISHHIRQRV